MMDCQRRAALVLLLLRAATAGRAAHMPAINGVSSVEQVDHTTGQRRRACPTLPYNQSGQPCGQLTYHSPGDAAPAHCEHACCSAADCDVWQWRSGSRESNGGGCWMAPFRAGGPRRGCPAHQHPGPWVGASRIPRPLPTPPAPSPSAPSPPPSPWSPRWQNQGSYDAVMCEGTPFWWPRDQKMYLMECVCAGPLDQKGWGSQYGYYWGHAEQWFPEYRSHSYIRIRELESGSVVHNISLSIGFGFGAAFVDYDHGTLWISATANDRVNGGKTPRPYGPPHDHSCSEQHWECNGVWVFNSSDLLTWTRRQTDVKWNGPNTDIARVYDSPAHPTPPNLPPHRYIMATESGSTWAVNNNADGDLSHGWVTLPASKAHGGSRACPSVRYLPSDGYYYTVSGGSKIPLMRSKDLLVWETAKGPEAPFIQPSAGDVKTATSVMAAASSNLAKGHANLSFPFRSFWDHDANDADLCCESWGGASPEKGGPKIAYVLWGADGQGSTGWKRGPEGFAAMGTANTTLEKLLQSYF